MERLTDKDWHTTKFMGLNEREVLYRLWQIENDIYKETKFKAGDTVYFLESAPIWETNKARPILIREGKVKKIYIGKTKTTYYISHWNYGMRENRLYATKEEAEKRIEELKREKK